jgi:hypothetical protein
MAESVRPGEACVGDWIANWMPRETGPEPGDPWRGAILGFEDRPQSGQAHFPVDSMLGGGGQSRGDPTVVEDGVSTPTDSRRASKSSGTPPRAASARRTAHPAPHLRDRDVRMCPMTRSTELPTDS